MMWQPIETAPQRHGARALLWEPDDCVIGTYRFNRRRNSANWEDVEGFILAPTHWMQLPEPPKVAP